LLGVQKKSRQLIINCLLFLFQEYWTLSRGSTK